MNWLSIQPTIKFTSSTQTKTEFCIFNTLPSTGQPKLPCRNVVEL